MPARQTAVQKIRVTLDMMWSGPVWSRDVAALLCACGAAHPGAEIRIGSEFLQELRRLGPCLKKGTLLSAHRDLIGRPSAEVLCVDLRAALHQVLDALHRTLEGCPVQGREVGFVHRVHG